MSFGVIHRTAESEKHACNVSTIIIVDERIITGSDDGVIKVWSSDLKLISQHDLNTGGFLSIAADASAIYTCASDQNIHIWDKKSFEKLGQLSSTLNVPLKLFVELGSNILWAGDSSGNVAKYVERCESGKWELSEEVWDLLVTSNPTYIYTARDRDIAVTEIAPGSGPKTHAVLRGTIEGRYPIAISGQKFCCLNREGRNILVHDNSVATKFKLLREIQIGGLIINALVVGEGEVYVAGYDGKVTRVDLASGTVTSSVEVGCCVNALAKGSQGVFAALADGQILQIVLN